MMQTQLEMMDQCLRLLTTAVSTASLYNAEHPQVVRLCTASREKLNAVIGEAQEVSLMRVDDKLAVDGRPLTPSLYINRFARNLKTCGIGSLKLLRDVSVEELRTFVQAMSERRTEVHSSEHLRLGQVEVKHSGEGGLEQLGKRAIEILGDVSGEELARIMEVYTAVTRNRKLHVVGLSEIVAEFVDIFSSYSDPLLTLVPLRNMDEYTFTHSLNVCMLNIAQATSLGIDGPLLHDIGLSAMLHDIGKLFIPEAVLNKPGKLELEEWELLKTHPIKGAEYLVKTPGVPRMAVVNAFEHHMRYDSLGYPTVSESWEQNLCSQMTAISDVFDSLRTMRPYRQPMDVDDVLMHISQLSGRQLHPDLTENFLRLMRRVHAA
jgi:HD-GYP domain-containing protein (c-di-GMP phosphodiesterase class II)